MASSSLKIYSFYNRAKARPVNFQELTDYLRSIEGWESCENFPNAGKSLYTHSVEHVNVDGHHFVDGYLKFGSYGMNQSHHDVERIEGENPIPRTHATTKDFYFMFYDYSENAESKIPYFFGCQLWGRENPFTCIK